MGPFFYCIIPQFYGFFKFFSKLISSVENYSDKSLLNMQNLVIKHGQRAKMLSAHLCFRGINLPPVRMNYCSSSSTLPSPVPYSSNCKKTLPAFFRDT